ncbi:Sterile alpha motif domain-containing protein 13 [Halotydeus destructor]|nr:Sterile alpha motif domain-containing protein 13 [Halotydeus destructor]
MASSSVQSFDYDIILEAIDALRARKARPDKPRIVGQIQRKYTYDKDEIILVLDHAVMDGTVLKVRYKDGYSYRNPERSTKTKRSETSPKTYLNIISRHRIMLAVRRLSKAAVDNRVTIKDIMFDLIGDKAIEVDEEAIIKTLNDEVQSGNLQAIQVLDSTYYAPQRLHNENSLIEDETPESEGDQDFESPEQSEAGIKKRPYNSNSLLAPITDTQLVDQRNGSEDEPQRVSQRKKFKKSLGPDFLDPSDLGHSFNKIPYDPICDICGNNFVIKDAIVNCNRCPRKAHDVCFGATSDEENSSSWLCSSCQHPNNVKDLLTSRYNQAEPKQPKVVQDFRTRDLKVVRTNGRKILSNGAMALHPLQLTNGNERAPDIVIRKFIGPPSPYCDIIKSCEEKKPVTWSVDEVENFVNIVGFPKEAQVFKEQEIDGKSLMLLRREDVLCGLKLKLGPAVKIFTHISQLQVDFK